MQESVQSRLGSLGADLIMVAPGFSRAQEFEGPRESGSSSAVNLTD